MSEKALIRWPNFFLFFKTCKTQDECLSNAAQALQKLVKFGSIGKVTLQAASRDSLCPAQYQTHERLLAQVKSQLMTLT